MMQVNRTTEPVHNLRPRPNNQQHKVQRHLQRKAQRHLQPKFRRPLLQLRQRQAQPYLLQLQSQPPESRQPLRRQPHNQQLV